MDAAAESPRQRALLPSEERPTDQAQQTAPGAAPFPDIPRRPGRQEQLESLGLKPGACAVYRVNGRILAWGDLTHCPDQNITHNIRVLAGELQQHPRRWGIAKCYDADLSRMEARGDWERIQREVRDCYKEPWLLVGEDGALSLLEEHEDKPSTEPTHTEPERRQHMENHRNGHKNGSVPTVPLPAASEALDILWDGLSPGVAEQLAQPLDPSLVSYRRGRGGRSVPYLEGHLVIAQANKVFGFGGWGYEVVGDVTCREARQVDAKTGEIRVTLFYCATVKVTVAGAPPRADVGCQPVAEDTADGHDTAYKGAVTDGLKRALRSFGDRFGNGLYGDGMEDTITPALRDSILELGRVQGLTLERLREAVRQRTGKEMDTLSASELAPLVQAMTRKLQAPANGRPSTSSAGASR